MSPVDNATLRGSLGVPTHLYPEDAARALGKVVRHAGWRQQPDSPPARFPHVRQDEVAAILAEVLSEQREWLTAGECERLLGCYGIAVPESLAATDPHEAGEAAETLGGHVALKAHGPRILHKTELGAVRTRLRGRDEVALAARQMDESLARTGVERESFLVQRMVGGGVELLVGVATDPVFGPVVACGAGGTAVELLGDVSVRVPPLRWADAEEMIHSLAIFPMLTGFRGMPPVDLDALGEVLLRVGALADSHREIVELDVNPLLASADGAIAADARVRVASPPPRRPWPATWS
jgi:acyl-CoA synthetase (NDP forming)